MKERIDDLQYKGLRLIQIPGSFCFGLDAVLLADFAEMRKGAHVLDIGTGTGIAAILINAKKDPSHVTGLEIQPEMADMAIRSVRLNRLEDKIDIICGDVKDSHTIFKAASFDAVVTNPPYIRHKHGLISKSDAHAVSRHEIMCTLEDIIESASFVLKEKGVLTMVHRPDRLVDIMTLMRKYRIEPKYLRFVHPSMNRKPNLVLIRGMKNGQPELKMVEPLYVYGEDGEYTDEINRIYMKGNT